VVSSPGLCGQVSFSSRLHARRAAVRCGTMLCGWTAGVNGGPEAPDPRTRREPGARVRVSRLARVRGRSA